MTSGFRFDKRGVEKVVNRGMKRPEAKAQRAFDALVHKHAGKPVDEVVPHIERAFAELEWTADAHEVRKYAQAVSEGKRIVFEANGVHL